MNTYGSFTKIIFPVKTAIQHAKSVTRATPWFLLCPLFISRRATRLNSIGQAKRKFNTELENNSDFEDHPCWGWCLSNSMVLT